MGLFDPLLQQFRAARSWSPAWVRGLATAQLSDIIEREAHRARGTIEALAEKYPSAGPRELAQRLVDQKKSVASMVGGVTGVFGLISVPVDMMGMVYLQLALLTEVATVFKVNLKSEHARAELLDVFGYANGIGALQRASPRLLGSLAALVLSKGGLSAVSRAVPLVAAPISAYLNNQHIQAVGDAAVRHYDGWARAHEKTKRAYGS
jgi:hypothetical protein